jgi:hypothetical protein
MSQFAIKGFSADGQDFAPGDPVTGLTEKAMRFLTLLGRIGELADVPAVEDTTPADVGKTNRAVGLPGAPGGLPGGKTT